PGAAPGGAGRLRPGRHGRAERPGDARDRAATGAPRREAGPRPGRRRPPGVSRGARPPDPVAPGAAPGRRLGAVAAGTPVSPSAEEPDLGPVRSLALAVARPRASAADIAASIGPSHDPFGRGEQWTVAHPRLRGASSATVFVETPGTEPALVTVAYGAG